LGANDFTNLNLKGEKLIGGLKEYTRSFSKRPNTQFYRLYSRQQGPVKQV
jgi:hypothetical protein